MKSVEIVGLTNKPRNIVCGVRVLGDPKLFDPAEEEDIPLLQHMLAVSPNRDWMALVRKSLITDNESYSMARTQEGAAEVEVPLESKYVLLNTQPRDVANDGIFLFDAELSGSPDQLHFSRRPLVFKVGDKKPTILPPVYVEPEWDDEPLKGGFPYSHTPVCFTPDGRVFGRTYDPKFSFNLPHCVWQRQPSGEWTIDYLPDFTHTKWLWPAWNGAFTACDWTHEYADIGFGLFDGTSYTSYESLTVHGRDCKIVSVSQPGIFIGHFCTVTKEDHESRSFGFLANPATGALHVFNDFHRRNASLHYISANGRYVIGSHPPSGNCILRADGDGYNYATYSAPGWRIETAIDVTDEGNVYGTATCLDRKHGCFRLKLPVLLVPQW